MRGLLVVLFLTSFCADALAQSQPPTPSGREARQPEKAKSRNTDPKSHNEQPNPAQPPIVVNVIPPAKTDAERAAEEEERKQKSALDRRLVDFTADLARYTYELAQFTAGVFLATVALGIATIGLLVMAIIQSRDTKWVAKATEEAANAARASADALPKIERAYIFVHPIWDNFDSSIFNSNAREEILNGQSRKRVVKIQLANWGTTPAPILEIRGGLAHMEGVPPTNGHTGFPPSTLREAVFAPATSFEMDITDDTGLTADHLSMLERRGRTYFLQGRVLYRTVIDDPNRDPVRETTFCWWYDFGTKVWAEWDGSTYNWRT